MRAALRLTTLAALLAGAVMLAACSGGAATGELIADESPVPDGMPVMYEFFTLT